MKAFRILLAAQLLAAMPAFAQEGAGSAAPDAGPPALKFSETIQEFLDEKGGDGQPVVGEAERKYLAALPEHTREILGETAEDSVGGPKHLQLLLSLALSPQGFETVLQDKCVLCHTDVDNQKQSLVLTADPEKNGAAPFMNIKDFVSDVHFRRGLSCAGCHGGDPHADLMGAEIAERWPAKDVRKTDRTWIPEFCAKCHSDPTFMRDFNPALATDQLAKYRESKHGQRVLGEHDSKAAQCVSCHGAHGIRGPKSPKSMVHPQRVPETCGACHGDPKHMAGYKLANGDPIPTNQLEQYKKSVHGKALLEKGELGSAACNDCHGNHAAMPPQVASVSQVCRSCHVLNGQLFDSSKHKEAFQKHGWPECEQCHGKHDIQAPDDALMAPEKGRLCHDCHEKKSGTNKECDETATYFHETLGELAGGVKRLTAESEELAEKGLDVEPLSFRTNDLLEALVQSRARIHSFDKGSFDKVAGPGREALADSEKLVHAAEEEFRFRRAGLLGAAGFTFLLAIVIYLKVRRMERRL